ncbi:MAG: hypothetical protein U1F34_01785 [Gammaproteobacteria bacterium]
MSVTLDKLGQSEADPALLPLKPVTIALIGVTPEDRNTLLDVFEQLVSRSHTVQAGTAAHASTDVLLVNADDARTGKLGAIPAIVRDLGSNRLRSCCRKTAPSTPRTFS